jgi:hypothetical protein
MKTGILLLALFIPFVSIGQSLKDAKKALKKINSLEQIDDLKNQKATVGGQPLDRQKTYSILACERDGDPVDMLCRIKGVFHPKNTAYTLHKVMESYLTTMKVVTPQPQGNAKVLDAPQTLLTQVTGVPYEFK